MKALRCLIVLGLLLPACLQKGGGISRGEHPLGLPGASTSDAPSPGDENSLDTPPIAGPSEVEDLKPKDPHNACAGIDDIECVEVLHVNHDPLCARAEAVLNPMITGSQATVSGFKPLTTTGFVTFGIVTFVMDGDDGMFPDDVDSPSGLPHPKAPDSDPLQPGLQLAANPDGTVTFGLVAEDRVGDYEFWVVGDLGVARGAASVEDCDGTGDFSSDFSF